MTALTKKAIAALEACARGEYPGTSQMVDRLTNGGLINIGYPEPITRGYWLTEAGVAELQKAKTLQALDNWTSSGGFIPLSLERNK